MAGWEQPDGQYWPPRVTGNPDVGYFTLTTFPV